MPVASFNHLSSMRRTFPPRQRITFSVLRWTLSETDGELEINFFDFSGYSEDGAFGTDLEVFLPDAMTKEILDLA